MKNTIIQIPSEYTTKLSIRPNNWAQTKSVQDSPRISIVMPCFNHEQFIERSILSVLNQNWPNLEFIIIDGGSADKTIDIIKKYERYIAYWISEPDNGQSDALNKGFAKATGSIYGWLNSDDLYMPGAFQSVVDAFSAQNTRQIVFGDWVSIDTEDQIIAHNYAFDFNLNHFKYEGFHVNAQAMFWRSDMHKRFGGFDINLHRTMDYQLILRLGIEAGDTAFYRLPEPIGCFRRHADQKTRGVDEIVYEEHYQMARRYGYEDKYEFSGKLKRIVYRWRRAYWYFKRGGIAFLLAEILK